MNQLKRFWFEFKIESAFDFPPGIGIGCGVTAFSYDDAIKIMDDNIFNNIKRPFISNFIENVDIGRINNKHVIANMKLPINRGVWFPLGYD